MKFFYETTEEKNIEIRARMEGDGMMGDFRIELTPGQDFYGHSFDELSKNKSGVLEIPAES